MKKSLCTLFLVLICIISLSGCSVTQINPQIFETNAIRILRQTDNDNKITLSYVFPMNSNEIKNIGFSETDVLTYKFYLSTYVNTLASNNRKKAVEGVYVSNCVYYSDIDGVGFSIVFDDLDAQKEFFGVEEDKNDNIQQNFSGFFIKKLEFSTKFPISSAENAEQVKLVCSMATVSWCVQNNISQEKRNALEKILNETIFIYDTTTPSNSLKSENMYEANGLYHNVFIKNINDLKENNEIKFYISYPNVAVWYLCALIVVILGMIVAYILLSNKKFFQKLRKIKK